MGRGEFQIGPVLFGEGSGNRRLRFGRNSGVGFRDVRCPNAMKREMTLMVERLRLGAGNGSPLIISVANVDVNGADYLNQVFNANTAPLRVWHTGYIVAFKPKAPGALPLPYPVPDPSGRRFVTAAGTSPLFMVMGRQEAGPPLTTPYRNIGISGGWGGLMTPEGQFVAWQQMSNDRDTTAYVNYCIFRNYG